MMLVDTDLLIYATFVNIPEHERCRSWLQEQLARGEGAIVLCWPVAYAFARLITSSRVFGQYAVSVADGWLAVQAYLTHPGVRLVTPAAGHQVIAAELAQTPGLRSDDIPDIEIAALAVEHGLILASHDRGFRRFSGLRVMDPLEAR